jgi:hypothetical protein
MQDRPRIEDLKIEAALGARFAGLAARLLDLHRKRIEPFRGARVLRLLRVESIVASRIVPKLVTRI